MQTPFTPLVLPPVYRHAQCMLSRWFDAGRGDVRREAFRARTAVSRLDAADRHRLARWLAWIVAAERVRGSRHLDDRLRQLDASLHQQMRTTLALLPPLDAVGPRSQRPVSADTPPHMTSVNAPR
ncbi:MAG: hypothetical protein KGN77_07530 [Xanthomonadaceae bacterium]|nr:hypothetical protein [Xanthomonadaceae bacterium]MDE1965367.1 hypothetical protein [Xanthomonadaceae bacterium]